MGPVLVCAKAIDTGNRAAAQGCVTILEHGLEWGEVTAIDLNRLVRREIAPGMTGVIVGELTLDRRRLYTEGSQPERRSHTTGPEQGRGGGNSGKERTRVKLHRVEAIE